MAEEVTDQETKPAGGEAEGTSKTEATSGEQAKAPEGATKEDFEALRGELLQAKREAAAAQEYAQRIVTELQTAAMQANAHAEAPDADALRDRLNENPQEVLDRHFVSRMQPLIRQNLEYQVNTARTLFEQRFGDDDDYKAYREEFNKFMETIPPEVKANPAAWDNALDFVRSKHLDEITSRRARKMAEKNAAVDRAAFVEGPSAGAGTRAAKPKLTDDMKSIAKGLGMSEEDYAHWLAQP